MKPQIDNDFGMPLTHWEMNFGIKMIGAGVYRTTLGELKKLGGWFPTESNGLMGIDWKRDDLPVTIRLTAVDSRDGVELFSRTVWFGDGGRLNHEQ